MNKYKYIYFLGIGGIGMSAIARYFNTIEKCVCGYDLTKTELTKNLENENINIHYKDDVNKISNKIKTNKNNVLVIYTPAIPPTNSEFIYFKQNNYKILKRAEVLGLISKSTENIAIAGTHGKTTVSTLVAHILYSNNSVSAAFLGGISKNYNSNLLLKKQNLSATNIQSDNYIILEADEYDRTFHNFYPKIALVTSLDTDHLDIYKTKNNIIVAFEKFISQTNKNGFVILNNKVNISKPDNTNNYTYSLSDKTDFFAKNIKIDNGFYTIDLQTPTYILENIKIGIPGLINVENSVAAAAVAYLAGIGKEVIKSGLETYQGVKRRFDIQIASSNMIYIDDYAHHPEEIFALLNSVKKMYPSKKITGIFQPHLFSRTKDFVTEFAKSLSLLDDLLLLDIYPAREKPIEGVSSKIIFDKVNINNKILCKKSDVINILKNKNIEVLLTIGAGDIDTLVEKITLNYINRK